ncbi:helix-turn-helix domain-containing protein [Shewanella sp. 4t3-1-2LB]|jgi:HTH-type transcriptional regulator/antitoxin HipB|uniref:helix-turn-helix domain-containing protein n=1 Tax=Shewanella sp. 4t3-1-2LB TaxID=2817682 RepID=UPI001A980C5B|nr:helix-turn-helix domain-containing protein [Shewanella sp. 4t3-1-2LB]MBO1273260.1 helix-turn-helix domain-containing protein [Shewanella sp. 4t3-1-2LB]
MKITTTQQLSAYLKDVRLSDKKSQADVANKVGIRQDTVSSFERSPESTKLETFFKLLSALELELSIQPRNSSTGQDNASAWKEEW